MKKEQEREPDPIPGEPVGRAEEADDLRLLRAGHSQHEVARRVGRAQSTVSRVAREHGIEPYRAPQAANEGRRHHARQRRSQLREKFLEAIETQLEQDGLSARDIRELSVALGVIQDKALADEKYDPPREALSETPTEPEESADVGTFFEPGPGAPKWLREEFEKVDEQLRRGEY